MSNKFLLNVPEKFDFRQTVYSHGWYQLLPFEIDRENCRLSYVFDDNDFKKPITAVISEADGTIEVEIFQDKIEKTETEKIIRAVRHVLRFDDDLQEFYQSVSDDRKLSWIGGNYAGRLLRSPTVWEDLVKTICTTNCSWALTKKMTANIVEKLGDKAANGKRAFPTAEKMAKFSEDFYKNEIRAGYRAAYFAELAQTVASGKISPENWLDSELSTKELKQEIKKIKGVGDYAAENLLKLVGRYDGLALDSWLRSQFYKKHNNAQVCDDKQIETHYERYGSWRGLAIWCDMSEPST